MQESQKGKQVWSEPRLTEIKVRTTETPPGKSGTVWDGMGHHAQSES